MMKKAISTLAASPLAGAALAQSGAQVHASAATDAARLIPLARKTKQPAEAGKPVK
ncbi:MULTISPECIES: hypothetical protein [unclassified Janthinobacterium]|uniref:hypothetical protein n=1 Tax=unclassified Janthinobacterium TaxID=2610881 RepID=UPI0012FE4602|nr:MULTISPECIES: hypothetical protein [unclassified Janthinobacterium]